jgi:hypothetical protein
VVGNCLDPISAAQRYDRIYCGAACPEEYISNITDLLKVRILYSCKMNKCLQVPEGSSSLIVNSTELRCFRLEESALSP